MTILDVKAGLVMTAAPLELNRPISDSLILNTLEL